MKLIKYLHHVLTIKNVLDDGTHTLSYFHKYSVASCNNQKDYYNCFCEIIKNYGYYCDYYY